MFAKQILLALFAQTSVQAITYNTAWENGTGYYDNAVKGDHAPVLKAGEVVKTESLGGRKIIMVGTPLGNVVVFGRYADADSSVVVSNMPRAISNITESNSSLSAEKVAYLLGVCVGTDMIYSYDESNIGHFINGVVTAAQKMKQLETV